MVDSRGFSKTMRIDIAPEDLLDQPDKWNRLSGEPEMSTEPACPVVGSPDFRELLANLYDGALITDMEGHVSSANNRALSFFKTELDVLCRRTVTSLISGAEESLMSTISESLQNERLILIQAFCIRSDDTVFPCEISVNKLTLSGDCYLCFFIRDTTERKKTEDWLRTGSAAIENAADAIAVATLTGALEYANPAMAGLLGLSSIDALLEVDLWTRLDQPGIADEIVSSVSAGNTWQGQLVLLSLNGNRINVQASFAPNINTDGELSGMVLSLLDVTEQINTNQSLRARTEQIEEDLQLAREFQQAFIGKQVPEFPAGVAPEESAIAISHIYRSSGMVGGDFFNILPVSDTRVGIFISDVMGHGVRSALISATVRGLLEELIVLAGDPGAFLTAVNRDLHALVTTGGNVAFVTALYMVLDLETGEAIMSSAGHPSPYWIKREMKCASRLDFSPGVRGPAMGIFADSEFHNESFAMQPGDTLLLFTDGIAECEDMQGNPYEETRMPEFLDTHAGLSNGELLRALMQDAEQFNGSDKFEDDICMVGLKLRHVLNASA